MPARITKARKCENCSRSYMNGKGVCCSAACVQEAKEYPAWLASMQRAVKAGLLDAIPELPSSWRRGRPPRALGRDAMCDTGTLHAGWKHRDFDE